MNEASLYIHSFLMHRDIPFMRCCHAPCHSRADWRAAVRKVNAQAVPVFSAVTHDAVRDSFCMTLSAGPDLPDDGQQAVRGRLRCAAHTLSPLALVFVQESPCSLYVPSEVQKTLRLCMPCADETESVILRTEDFLTRFADAAHIQLL